MEDTGNMKIVEKTAEGPVLLVSGINLRDKTPIYDIKPYLPYVDSHPEARGGFAAAEYELEVVFPQFLLEQIPAEKRNAVADDVLTVFEVRKREG